MSLRAAPPIRRRTGIFEACSAPIEAMGATIWSRLTTTSLPTRAGTRSAPRRPDHPRDHPFASMQRASNSARFCSAATPSNPAEAVSFDALN
jgi:hypothetical protein